jgi:hypothetical protein
MKLSVSEFKKRLISNRGELIVETIVSFLVLAILISAVFLVIGRAMTLAGNSSREARISQEGEVNPSLLSNFEHSVPVVIEFWANGVLWASHDINFNTAHAPGDPACTRCPTFPACPAKPCPICCNCNNSVAFAPVVP